MNTSNHGFKHGEITQKIIGVFYEVCNERLIFDNPRKAIRENPCLSVAELLTPNQ
jgi:hypothetical protein